MENDEHQAEEDNGNKRRRLTGTSKWVMNAITRKIAERQAVSDVEEMLRQQGGSDSPIIDELNTVGTECSESDVHSAPASSDISVSCVCDDEADLAASNERDPMQYQYSQANDLVGITPLVESVLMDSEFSEAVFIDNEELSTSDWETTGSQMLNDLDQEGHLDEDDDFSVTAANDFERIEITRLLAATFYLKHGLSQSALGDFLEILNISSELYDNEELKSPHMFMKRYGLLKGALKRIYPCTTCSVPLKNDESGHPTKEQTCGHNYSKELSDNCYTLLLPIDEQVKFFLRHHGIKKTNPASPGDEDRKGDVFTGDRYKQYVKDGLINDETITMQINTDGAQLFKASKYSFWPFMGIINETGYKTRRSNVILMAIWFGNKKPPRGVFLDACVDEMKKLCSFGISCDGKTYKVRPVVVTVDSVARPTLRNTIQFNGAYGCDFCLHPGNSVEKGRGHCLVYCEQRDDSQPRYPLRSTLQYRNDLKEAIKSGKTFRGIKGPTSLADIEGFDFIGAFVPEYMHCICLGVIRFLILLWISPSHSKEPWYIDKTKLAILNKRLSNTLPPYDITRTPRTLDTIKYWKASEFRAFALYYFPLLEGILPEPYFTHFASLSYALSVLLQESVPTHIVKDVEFLLIDFVKKVELLYGEKYVKFNIHLLTHLSKSVLDWGCLWATSAFIPEWFNGQLQGLTNGTQAVVEQMASSFLMRNSVRNQAIELFESQSVPPNVSKLIRKMICLPNMYQFKNSKSRQIDGKVSLDLLGKQISRMLSLDEQSVVENTLLNFDEIDDNEREKIVDLIENSPCSVFPRLNFRNGCNSIFTTSSYVRSKKRINYCALLSDGRFFFIENFIFIEQANPNFQVFILGRSMGGQYRKIYSPRLADKEFVCLPGQTTKLAGLGDFEAVLPHQIARKCVVASYNSLLPSFIITALTNTLESD